MKNFLRNNWAVIIALLILYITVSILLITTIPKNQNHFVYTLDDAYIHMSLAKNLALYDVWGVTKYEFTSCSSSLLWTLMLAFIYQIFRPNQLSPLILNIVFASMLIVSTYLILKKNNIKKYLILTILICLIFLTPLPPLMFTGLEHVLHIWISILFIYLASLELSDNSKNKKRLSLIIFLAMLLPMIRYEGIIITLFTALFLTIRRKPLSSFLLFTSSFLPIFIFGLISVKNGWSFFPNSLLLKGNLPDVVSLSDFINFLIIILKYITSNNILFLFIIISVILILFLILLFGEFRFLHYNSTYLILLFITNLILYSFYSKSGWSYRYQSFIIALYIVSISLILNKDFQLNFRKRLFVNNLIFIIFIFIPFSFFVYQGINLMMKTPQSSTNIYEQQYQIGQFLSRYYQEQGVALNDVGAANYFADIRCLDLWGLSNIEISKKRRFNDYGQSDIREMSLKNDIKIAILYDSWFEKINGTLIPKEWIKVGEWRILNNVIAGDDKVSFYAINKQLALDLIKALKSFYSEVPKTVRQSGIYLN